MTLSSVAKLADRTTSAMRSTCCDKLQCGASLHVDAQHLVIDDEPIGGQRHLSALGYVIAGRGPAYQEYSEQQLCVQ